MSHLLVIPARLERATHSLEGCCSIQLSYGTKGMQRYYFFTKCQEIPGTSPRMTPGLPGAGAHEELELLVEGFGEALRAFR